MTRAMKKTAFAVVGASLVGGITWLAIDLWGPRSANLRRFDPGEVAHLDTEMWRSYYDKERVRLFNQLAFLLRRQYHMQLLRSYVVGFHAAKAAFIFKDGKNRIRAVISNARLRRWPPKSISCHQTASLSTLNIAQRPCCYETASRKQRALPKRIGRRFTKFCGCHGDPSGTP